MDRELELTDDRPRGRIEAWGDGRTIGHLDYFVLAPPDSVHGPQDPQDPEETAEALVAVHTVVEKAYAGQGVAGRLVRELYARAGREHKAVVPLCSYAASWAERHPGEAPAAPDRLVAAAKERLATDPTLW
ncbi:N-acetyltransferase [Streptomyces spiroverticillatus]|uniref:N-acetyltransferase n=1 Tax=Streptomyces finlayi TaxID=67296 RepID=A0A918X3T6_9ACTN|nr:GNAT family N-acetyltransferase [Streptomyces finlayi]GHA26161.1 N-acetyltransferase [Streptomyces spiroverticillatus]GHD07736.1 N-acetyltransferase [Streptomyces finlayi]